MLIAVLIVTYLINNKNYSDVSEIFHLEYRFCWSKVYNSGTFLSFFFFFHLLTVENVFPVIFLLFVRLVTDGLMESYFGLQKIMPRS